MTNKLVAGDDFPPIRVSLEDGTPLTLGQTLSDATWQAVFVYRGQHCPLCTKYLNQINDMLQDFLDADVEVVAVSADSAQQLAEHREKIPVDFPLGYGLSIEQMQQLGLYLSDPRSPQETDHVFAEPGLFVINESGQLHVVDLSNNPFVRPELNALLNGLKWIRNPENNYPIRGMHV